MAALFTAIHRSLSLGLIKCRTSVNYWKLEHLRGIFVPSKEFPVYHVYRIQTNWFLNKSRKYKTKQNRKDKQKTKNKNKQQNQTTTKKKKKKKKSHKILLSSTRVSQLHQFTRCYNIIYPNTFLIPVKRHEIIFIKKSDMFASQKFPMWPTLPC